MTSQRAADRRQDILVAIKASVRERGFPPSTQELAERYGVSRMQISYDLQALEAEAYIERVVGPGGKTINRGIRILTASERKERLREQRTTTGTG
jgi:DNA-binding GntR family transcriptional regulator